MTLAEERQEKIRQTFSSFEDSDGKWRYLLRIAKEHPGMPKELKDEKFIVQGCAARMFLVPRFEKGTIQFFMDTEEGLENPLISRGLGALAIKLYNGLSPKEILEIDPKFFQEIGLTLALSATRANGFASLIKQIYLYAKAYSALSASK